jgi:streptogramin lyase
MTTRLSGDRRWLVSLAALLLVATSSCSSPAGGPAPTAGAGGPEPSVAASSSAASASPAASETDVDDAGAQSLAITGDWLSAGDKGVWLSGETAIYRLNPATGATVATVPVPQGPCEASATGLGALWTATCTKPGLARIDPATNKVSAHRKLAVPADLDGEASIGVGGGYVWLVVDGPDCSACRLAQIEPTSLQVVRQIPVSEGSAGVRFGEGAVWVTNPYDGTVTKIDYRRHTAGRVSRVGAQPRFFAVGEGAVWTLDQADGDITRLDPDTGKSTPIDLGFAGPGGDMTTGGGWVWARGSDQLLARIDPRTNEVAEIYGPASGSGAVIVGFGAVWFSAHDVGTVWRMPLVVVAHRPRVPAGVDRPG